MSIGIYMYDQSPLFEISVLSYILHTKYDIILMSNSEKLCSSEGITYECTQITSIANSPFDALVICGGNIGNIEDHQLICKLIRKMAYSHKPIGAICAGKDILCTALNMDSCELDRMTTINEHILISPPQQYASFGVEFGKLIGIYKDLDDYLETVSFFCNK